MGNFGLTNDAVGRTQRFDTEVFAAGLIFFTECFGSKLFKSVGQMVFEFSPTNQETGVTTCLMDEEMDD